MIKVTSHIEFDVTESFACMKSEWGGCCCECVHHAKVNKHCCHNPKEPNEGCICGDWLGFYVCTCFHELEENERVNILGEHGYCEMFRRKLELS